MDGVPARENDFVKIITISSVNVPVTMEDFLIFECVSQISMMTRILKWQDLGPRKSFFNLPLKPAVMVKKFKGIGGASC